eukprot:6195468-Heterocapsa_arctica.AAC.1
MAAADGAAAADGVLGDAADGVAEHGGEPRPAGEPDLAGGDPALRFAAGAGKGLGGLPPGDLQAQLLAAFQDLGF